MHIGLELSAIASCPFSDEQTDAAELAANTRSYVPASKPTIEPSDLFVASRGYGVGWAGAGQGRPARHVARLKPYGITLVAEKLETHADHAYCFKVGCDLFQGFFFYELLFRGGPTSEAFVIKLS